MPESKKLSELISDLSRFHARAEYTDDMSEYHKTIEIIGLIKNQIDQKFEELRCITPGPVMNLNEMLKEWKESLRLFEQVMESKKKEYPLFEGKNEFYLSEENARKGIQEIKEILFRRGNEIQKRMLEIIYDANSKRDSKKSE